MRKSRFTEEQIAMALRQGEAGTAIEEICRRLGVSEATYFRWKKKYGGLGISELRELRQLRDENRKLKGIVGDLTLDRTMLQEALRKKWCCPRSAGSSQRGPSLLTRFPRGEPAGPLECLGRSFDIGADDRHKSRWPDV